MIRVGILLFAAVEAALMVLSQYNKDETCSGSPSAVVGFNVIDPEEESPLSGEVWPVNYDINAPPYPIGLCDNSQVALKGLCCYSLIENSDDWSVAQGVLSAQITEIDNLNDLASAVPKTSSSATYCKLEKDARFPYLVTYLLADGSCFDNYLSCDKNGQIHVYPSAGCKGEAISFILTRSPAIFNSTYGAFTGSLGSLSGGSNAIEWVAYRSATYLIPNHKAALEIIALLFYIVSIVCSVLAFLFWALRYRKSKGVQTLLMLCSQFWTLFYIVSRMAYSYSVLISDFEFYFTGGLNDWTFGIATLLTTISNCYFVNSVFKPKKIFGWITYFSIVCLHIGLMIGIYVRKFTAFYGPKATHRVFRALAANDIYWIGIYFVYSILPLMFVVWRLTAIHNHEIIGRLKAIHRIDPSYYGTVLGQVLCFAMYFIIRSIQVYSNGFGTNRNYLAAESLKAACVSINSFLTCVLVQRLKSRFAAAKTTKNSVTGSSKQQIKTSAPRSSTVG
jgi:hypothetical protein